MKARPGRYCAVRWKDGKVFADAAAEVGAAWAAQDYRDRTGETTAVVKDGKLVRIYTVLAKKNTGQRTRRNPLRSESAAWQKVMQYARRIEKNARDGADVQDARNIMTVAAEMGVQVARGFHANTRARRNPLLGIFGPNPKARVVKELGRVVQVRYKRKDDGKLYYHPYTSRPRLLALSDGSIWIKP